jgi:hypothetical protein
MRMCRGPSLPDLLDIGQGEDACHGGNNEDQHEQTVTTGRVSAQVVAGNEKDAVLRLLRGQLLEVLSRELEVEARRLAA